MRMMMVGVAVVVDDVVVVVNELREGIELKRKRRSMAETGVIVVKMLVSCERYLTLRMT